FWPVRASAELVRKGATAFSLGFQIRNIFPARDPYEFAKNTIDQATVGNLPEFYKRAYLFELAAARGDVRPDVIFEMFKRLRGDDLRYLSFDKNAPQSAYDKLRESERGPVIRKISSGVELFKNILSFMGAGENAPRALEFRTFLEKNGWTEARIKAEVE